MPHPTRWLCKTPRCGAVLGIVDARGDLRARAPEVVMERSGVLWVRCEACGGQRAWLPPRRRGPELSSA